MLTCPFYPVHCRFEAHVSKQNKSGTCVLDLAVIKVGGASHLRAKFGHSQANFASFRLAVHSDAGVADGKLDCTEPYHTQLYIIVG